MSTNRSTTDVDLRDLRERKRTARDDDESDDAFDAKDWTKDRTKEARDATRTRAEANDSESLMRARKRTRWDAGGESNVDDDARDASAGEMEKVAEEGDRVASGAKAGALDRGELAKRKLALAKQKELAAKMKAAKGGGKIGESAKAPTRPSARPMALRLDALGREIDERGRLVDASKVIHTSTFKVNLKQQRADAFAQAQAEAQAELAAVGGGEFDDPRMAKVAARARKPRATLQVSATRARSRSAVSLVVDFLFRIFQSHVVISRYAPRGLQECHRDRPAL